MIHIGGAVASTLTWMHCHLFSCENKVRRVGEQKFCFQGHCNAWGACPSLVTSELAVADSELC